AAAHPPLQAACEIESRVAEGEIAVLDYAVGTLDRRTVGVRLAVHETGLELHQTDIRHVETLRPLAAQGDARGHVRIAGLRVPQSERDQIRFVAAMDNQMAGGEECRRFV